MSSVRALDGCTIHASRLLALLYRRERCKPWRKPHRFSSRTVATVASAMTTILHQSNQRLFETVLRRGNRWPTLLNCLTTSTAICRGTVEGEKHAYAAVELTAVAEMPSAAAILLQPTTARSNKPRYCSSAMAAQLVAVCVDHLTRPCCLGVADRLSQETQCLACSLPRPLPL